MGSDLTCSCLQLAVVLNTGQAAPQARGQGDELCGPHVTRKDPAGLPRDRPPWVPRPLFVEKFQSLRPSLISKKANLIR